MVPAHTSSIIWVDRHPAFACSMHLLSGGMAVIIRAFIHERAGRALSGVDARRNQIRRFATERYRASVQLSHKPRTQVLEGRPSRRLGQGRPWASNPVVSEPRAERRHKHRAHSIGAPWNSIGLGMNQERLAHLIPGKYNLFVAGDEAFCPKTTTFSH